MNKKNIYQPLIFQNMWLLEDTFFNVLQSNWHAPLFPFDNVWVRPRLHRYEISIVDHLISSGDPVVPWSCPNCGINPTVTALIQRDLICRFKLRNIQ
ncbi:hypothetical protein IEQ34_007150 [Dendrobium chrysotoxum]|uniref:Uncharacterized protein n=1 Tax=Dendrobium chrysotoxum TaxID=161865 RepID=A0AAV7H8D8_DENCH|nr:hypothetical protein IEQ34_007150 [Dendrobium chrysotoxum]